MPEPLVLILIFAISLFSNTIGGIISGGASLFSVGFLLLMGLSPSLAMSTYTLGSIPARLSAVWGYRKSNKIIASHIAPLAILGFIGSIIGTSLLINIEKGMATTITHLLLIGFIPLAFLKLNRGTKRIAVSRNKRLIGFGLYFILAIWTSFFAAWTGLICLHLYLYFFGFTILETKATDSLAGTAMALGSLIIFVSSGVFNVSYLLAYIPGAIIGGYLGAKWALHLGDTRLKILVWISIALVSVKTVFQTKSAQYIQQLLLIFR